MISLSKEWTILSRAAYGQEFINELAVFLRKYNTKTILECGCGDGYILRGLAERGFRGIGIDNDREMIDLALQSNAHPNIDYMNLNWLDLDNVIEQYDCVMCRGNSISSVVSWKKGLTEKDSTITRERIEKSVRLMLEKVRKGGLFYIDTTPETEIEKGGRVVELNFDEINIKGVILHDWKRRRRITYGGGELNGEWFEGGNVGYLMRPSELETIIEKNRVKKVWRPNLNTEPNYDVICAIR